MSVLPPRKYKPFKRIKPRKKPRRKKAIVCRPHCDWVIENYDCLLKGKINKRTGEMHVCVGQVEPHHDPSRGAGGGDNNVVPLCHGGHRLSHDDPRTEDDHDVNYRETGDALWQADWKNRVLYERSHQQ